MSNFNAKGSVWLAKTLNSPIVPAFQVVLYDQEILGSPFLKINLYSFHLLFNGCDLLGQAKQVDLLNDFHFIHRYLS